MGAAVLSVAASPASRFAWLPEHLLRPGWGGVWMIILAWLLIGALGVDRGSFTLERRLWVAAALAVLGLALYLIRIPVELERFGGEGNRIVLPRQEPVGRSGAGVGGSVGVGGLADAVGAQAPG